MAQAARSGDGHGQRRPAPQRKSPAATLLALALVLLVLAGAVVVYTLTNKKAAEAQPAAVPANPFADIPPEAPPEKQVRTKGQK